MRENTDQKKVRIWTIVIVWSECRYPQSWYGIATLVTQYDAQGYFFTELTVNSNCLQPLQYQLKYWKIHVNFIQDEGFGGGGWGGRGGGVKSPPTSHTSFSRVTSKNVEVSPQNPPTFSLTILPQWFEISRPYLVPVPNHWIRTKSTPQKNWFFWSNPYKIEDLKIHDFSHRNARITKLWSHGHIYSIIWVTW